MLEPERQEYEFIFGRALSASLTKINLKGYSYLMEKRKRTYDLAEIKYAFSDMGHLRVTSTGYRNAIALGIRRTDIVEIIQSLKPSDFYKSMTTYDDSRIWQDVYHAKYDDLVLYVKFIRDQEGYLVISFKEK